MPRDIPVGNGKLLVNFDHQYQLRDFYYPHVGKENHSADDPHIESTMGAVQQRLWAKTNVGGIARYEDDYYHQVRYDTDQVAGNPWSICTLWLAQWYIAKARTVEELHPALDILEWAARHALPSGVLAEQVHPDTGVPLSVSPLTWSHGTFIAAVLEYLDKFASLHLCPSCGSPMAHREHH